MFEIAHKYTMPFIHIHNMDVIGRNCFYHSHKLDIIIYLTADNLDGNDEIIPKFIIDDMMDVMMSFYSNGLVVSKDLINEIPDIENSKFEKIIEFDESPVLFNFAKWLYYYLSKGIDEYIRNNNLTSNIRIVKIVINEDGKCDYIYTP